MPRTSESVPVLTFTLRPARWAVLLCAVLGAVYGCSEPYVPGLGEIMSLTQMRHAKLFFAGEQSNWPLARYELDELREGFDDVVRFHPTHEGSPLPLKDLVPRILTKPLDDLDRAIEARDPEAFVTAFDALTAGCNSCHQAANFGFNVVRRPTGTWFGNQDFAPPE
jgi:hypothetical protein